MKRFISLLLLVKVSCVLFLTFFLAALEPEEATMNLTSKAFREKGAIPEKYTCDGENISPPLRWEGAPEGTKSFVLIVDDPDAPRKTWVHWILYNISATDHECAEGRVPSGAIQGVNDFGQALYGGPCPPSGVHRYFFKLYALNQTLTLSKGATKEQVEKAMAAHILGQAELIGTYSRQ